MEEEDTPHCLTCICFPLKENPADLIRDGSVRAPGIPSVAPKPGNCMQEPWLLQEPRRFSFLPDMWGGAPPTTLGVPTLAMDEIPSWRVRAKH
jgi:hypothetical protein